MPFPVVPLPVAFMLPSIAGIPDTIGRVVPPEATAVISTSLAALYDEWVLQDQKTQWGFFLPYHTHVTQKGGELPGDPKNLERGLLPILTTASVHSLDIEEAYAVSTAPQENGAFAAYNKVKFPVTGTVRMICDGFQTGSTLPVNALGQSRALWEKSARPVSIKQEFLNKLVAMTASTQSYTLKTPERDWDRVNIIGYHISRSPDLSCTMLYVDVRFVEIRSANTPVKATPKNPQGAGKIDNGEAIEIEMVDF